MAFLQEPGSVEDQASPQAQQLPGAPQEAGRTRGGTLNIFPPPPSVVLRMASTEFETPHDYDLPRQGGDEMGRNDGNTPRPNKPKPQKPKPKAVA